MNEQPQVDRLVKAYVAMRDKRSELAKEYEKADGKIATQMDMVESELMRMCKDIGADSIKTQYGTVFRTVKTRYETADWENMYKFVVENNIPQVLERRISSLNMKQFLEENPTLMPIGMNVNNRYTVTVRRK
jgi:hypothetical protein